MRKLKQFFTNTRIIVLLVFLLLSVVAIRPAIDVEGVAIRSVKDNSTANNAGIKPPEPTATPRSREVVVAINGERVSSVSDYEEKVSSLYPNQSITLRTNNEVYKMEVPEDKELGLNVYEAPNTNIKKGLDLQGGTRVLLEPKDEVGSKELELVIDNLKRRLNVYGLSDVIVREAGGLPPPLGQGQKYIMVEIPGINEEEVKNLLSQQGKFEAKIANETVFKGGDDVKYVCRTSECSGIDPQQGCQKIDQENNYMCRFRFSITLSQDAAQRQADVTENLSVIKTDEQGEPLAQEDQYLNKKLKLYLDGEKVDELNIGADLKGKPSTNIQISGSGQGKGRENAALNSLENMKELQTVLITGSLPVELEIVKTDSISPVLGEEFTENIMWVAILAIIAVAGVIFVRYRTWNVVMPILVTMASEVVLLLGLASLIGWRLDLSAIAGIIIAVGTGVDDQIVISDETLNREKKEHLTWKKRIKRAFFIIMVAYFTTVVAMLPLVTAGAGLLKGFAITTIAGVTFGVFVTRPAFGAMLEVLERE